MTETATLTVPPDETAVTALAERLEIGESTARAALLLDAVAPGWEKNVDLPTLDMSSMRFCIIGQQLGKHPYFAQHVTFENAIDLLGDEIGSRRAADDPWVYNFSRAAYDWNTLIKDRRSVE